MCLCVHVCYFLLGSQTFASDNILSTIKNPPGNISIISTGHTDTSTSEHASAAAQTMIPWVTRYGGTDNLFLEKASTTERSMTSTATWTFIPPVIHSTDASIPTSEASRKNDAISTFASDITTVGSVTQHFTRIPTKENIQREGITISLDSNANTLAAMPVNATMGIATETTTVMTSRSNEKMFTSMTTESATKSSMNRTLSDIGSTGTIFHQIVNSSTTFTQSSSGTETSTSIAPDNGDHISTFMTTITASETTSGREATTSPVSRTHTETFVTSSSVAVTSKNTLRPSLLANSPTTLSSISAASEILTSSDFTKAIEVSTSEASITEATVPASSLTSTESSLLKILFPLSYTSSTKATSAGSTSPTLVSITNNEHTIPLDSSSGGDISTLTISGNNDETSLPFAHNTASGNIIPETESSKRKRPIITAFGSTVEILSILTNITRAEESVEERSSFVAPGDSPEPTSSASSNTVTAMSTPVPHIRVTNTSNSLTNIAVTDTSTSIQLRTSTDIFLVSKRDARPQVSTGLEITSSLPSRSVPEISVSTDSTTQTSILSGTTYTSMGTISLAPKVAIISESHTTDSNPTLSRKIPKAGTGTNVTSVTNVAPQVPIPKAMPSPTIMTSTMTAGKITNSTDERE